MGISHMKHSLTSLLRYASSKMRSKIFKMVSVCTAIMRNILFSPVLYQGALLFVMLTIGCKSNTGDSEQTTKDANDLEVKDKSDNVDDGSSSTLADKKLTIENLSLSQVMVHNESSLSVNLSATKNAQFYEFYACSVKVTDQCNHSLAKPGFFILRPKISHAVPKGLVEVSIRACRRSTGGNDIQVKYCGSWKRDRIELAPVRDKSTHMRLVEYDNSMARIKEYGSQLLALVKDASNSQVDNKILNQLSIRKNFHTPEEIGELLSTDIIEASQEEIHRNAGNTGQFSENHRNSESESYDTLDKSVQYLLMAVSGLITVIGAGAAIDEIMARNVGISSVKAKDKKYRSLLITAEGYHGDMKFKSNISNIDKWMRKKGSGPLEIQTTTYKNPGELTDLVNSDDTWKSGSTRFFRKSETKTTYSAMDLQSYEFKIQNGKMVWAHSGSVVQTSSVDAITKGKKSTRVKKAEVFSVNIKKVFHKAGDAVNLHGKEVIVVVHSDGSMNLSHNSS